MNATDFFFKADTLYHLSMLQIRIGALVLSVPSMVVALGNSGRNRAVTVPKHLQSGGEGSLVNCCPSLGEALWQLPLTSRGTWGKPLNFAVPHLHHLYMGITVVPLSLGCVGIK